MTAIPPHNLKHIATRGLSPLRLSSHRQPSTTTTTMTRSSSSFCDAFVERVEVKPTSTTSSSLAGLTACVKDIFDMSNHTTGFGHPKWRETHQPATENAEVVDLLLSSGATVVGRTHMDELAWSLFGVNYHYGTPRNPNASNKIPGGSSSGSASAVADGLADIGMGTDTGGSVRVPASYCGLYGIRPTHGRVSLRGARSLAPSFDTCGWFARDAALLRRVGYELLPPPATRATTPLTRWLVAADAFDLADPAASEAIYGAIAKKREELSLVFSSPPPQEVSLDHLGGGSYDAWFEAFRVLQSREVWQELGPWVEANRPELGPGIRERFEYARTVRDSEVEEKAATRESIRARLAEVLGRDGFLMLPTTPGPPPTSNESPEVVTDLRARLLRLTSIAGLSGFPQVSIPVARVEGEGPVGLSLLGPPGSDEELLRLAERVANVL
mmetsp:Transcript_2918/g.10027  ORF Transcript_2918/g.10027 Transcript_2918/m.10027 type:complete len:442 (-) Transcript_2918:318-1643(-)